MKIKQLKEEIEKLNKERFEDLDKKVKEGKFDIDNELKILAENISQGKEFWRLIDLQIKEAQLQTLKDVLKLINGDIAYQKKQLTKGYEKDKSINWRIIGMRSLKQKIEGK